VAGIVPRNGMTPYARTGDAPVVVILVVAIGVLALLARRR